MERKANIQSIESNPEFDMVIIGGGATGIGAAVEAATRGYRTLLVEKDDFTKGTSSKTTKLIHGGVRYLAQGNIRLVREALRERGRLLANAPHLVHDQPFIMPLYRWWEIPFYTIGLKLYDLLAGRYSFGRSRSLTKRAVIRLLPGVNTERLKGGVLYHDGQFDDSRLAMDLLHKLHTEGGIAINYCEAVGLEKGDNGKISGVVVHDKESGANYRVTARSVINASGVWVDRILGMDNPVHPRTIMPSQGVHLVTNRDFLPGFNALMIPKTSDGRVLFAVPWHGKLVIGTTDAPVREVSNEPHASEEEIGFILNNAARYLAHPLEPADIRSVFTGLRPLAAPSGDGEKTKEVSRSHKIYVSGSGLITVVGGKWTTYRKMGEDIIDRCEKVHALSQRMSRTVHFRIGTLATRLPDTHITMYGDNAEAIYAMAADQEALLEPMHTSLPYTAAEYLWLAEHEMVVHLEDLLARRTRALLLDAEAAQAISEQVAAMVGPVLGWDLARQHDEVETFASLVSVYLPRTR